MLRGLGMVGFCLPGLLLFGAQQDEVTLLRWAGPPGSKPGTHREWMADHPYTDLSVRLEKISVGKGKAGTVVILTDSSIASSLTSEINELVANLGSEGYTVMTYLISGGSPEDLRSFLYGLYNSHSIEGALFIGDLPVPWFQIEDDYNKYGYKEWPIDLFYMDLDGRWLDSLKYVVGSGMEPGQDTVYDTHSGDQFPEIYVGRLTPTGIGSDVALIKNYFVKDTAYRHGTIEHSHRALVYIDDDWFPWAQGYANDVSLLYDDTSCVFDSNTTRASDYTVRLDTVRAWVSVFAHSWPGGHSFYYNDHGSTEYYWATSYTSQDPPANFYNHFACSFCRYTTNGYGGGRSMFTASYGVGAIGTTKTGSMLDFDYFYAPLSQGKTMGEAFKDWFTHIVSGGVTFNELCWHYGMTLLGDPFLKPTGHTSLAPPVLVSPDSGAITSDSAVTLVWGKTFDNAKYRIKIDGDSTETTDTTHTDTLAEGVYQWCVKTGNLSDTWSDYSGAWELTVDLTPPVIDSTTVLRDTTDFWGPFEVKSKVVDNFSFHNPVLFLRTSADTVWQADTMAGSAADWFTDSIPEFLHDTLTVDYYLTVQDLATNESRDPVSGMYSFHINQGPGAEELTRVPRKVTLISPMPNPLRSNASIKYGVPERSFVTLGLHDISGRLVATMYSGVREKGYYESNLNLDQMAEGVYFVRLRAVTITGQRTCERVKKIIIVR